MSRPSFRTVSISCSECGTTVRRAFHGDGQCDGLFVDVDGTVRCVDCGAEIPFSASVPCSNCGSQAELDSEPALPVVRPRVSVQRIESALAERILQGHSASLEIDQTLSAIARDDATLTVEAEYFDSDADKERSFGDRFDQHSANLEQTSWATFSVTVEGVTPERIAAETYDCHLSGWPEPDERVTFTHLGVGVQWAPVNDLYVCCVAQARSVRLPSDVAPGRLEKAIHRATDERRVDNGHGRLAYDERLADIALNYSRAQAVRGSIDHFAPDGTDVGGRYRNADYRFTHAGENLAKYTASAGTATETIAEDIVDEWMDSPDHRANILNDDFDSVGLGVYQPDDGHIFVTQNFSG